MYRISAMRRDTRRTFGATARMLPLLASLASIALAGCSADSIWPTLSGDTARAGGATGVAEPNATIPVAAAASSPSALAITSLPPFPSTGTAVGQRVAQIRGQLDKLESSLVQQAARTDQLRASTQTASETYHGTIAAIGARLQIGTTPGNPILQQQFGQAQAALDKINANITSMTLLANELQSIAAAVRLLQNDTNAAMGLAGAIDEDHRQIQSIQDQTARDDIIVKRLLGNLNTDVSRQSAYVAYERGNLSTLGAAIASGELVNPNAFRPKASPGAGIGTGAGAALESSPVAGRRPLVVIRFDRPDVAYQEQLSGAVAKALERRPDARFDVVGVASPDGTPDEALASAAGVVSTLNGLGLEPDRVSMTTASSGKIASNEVRVYIR